MLVFDLVGGLAMEMGFFDMGIFSWELLKLIIIACVEVLLLRVLRL